MIKVIAEFCQNHNGDETLLKEMIHMASEAGTTHAKIQTIFADDLAFRDRFETGEMVDGAVKCIKRPYKPEFDRLKSLELTYEQQARFCETCIKFGITPLTTCFSRGSIPYIKELKINTIKVASYDCGSLPMIKELADNFENIIISTGASYNEEIESTALLLKEKQKKFSFLHCVTIYPTPLDNMHLKRMEYLRKFTPSVGLSNHAHSSNDGIKADVAAVYLGAEYIERHFTVLPPEQTRDGIVSITPNQLKDIVSFSKLSKDDQKAYLDENVPEFEVMLGETDRELSHTELLNRDYYRGRFATISNGRTVYNWEEVSLP